MSELVVLAGRQDSQVRGLAAGSGAHQKRPFRCRCRSTTCPVRRHRMETRPSSAAFVRQPSEQPWEREREREKQRLIKVSVQASQQGSGAFCVFYDTKLMLHNPSQRTLIGQPVTTDRRHINTRPSSATMNVHICNHVPGGSYYRSRATRAYGWMDGFTILNIYCNCNYMLPVVRLKRNQWPRGNRGE